VIISNIIYFIALPYVALVRIVRILKSRKRLAHQELVGEVIHQIQNFAPESRLIRQRVEGLIEREYLKRDDVNPKYYIYLP